MFRFTIRELVLLTLVVAMGAAWWVDHRQIEGTSSKSDELRQELRSVMYDYKRASGNHLGIQLSDGEFIRSQAPQGILLRQAS